jgi:tRNA threonylcarbamoyladenosine biosynthesis protein TsaB
LKILGIDTSSKFLSIALSEDADIIKEESYLLDRRQAAELVPRIKALLGKTRVAINKIGAFVIGIGPGSFTGIRIGVSAVKGFGIALGKPCIGVSSLDAIACNAPAAAGDIVPVIDAKRGNVYAAVYRRKDAKIIRSSDYLILPVEKLLKKLKSGSHVFLGDGLQLYKDQLSRDNKKAIFLEEKYWYPNAGDLITLGFSKIQKAKGPGLDKLEPLYLYPEDCQVKKT